MTTAARPADDPIQLADAQRRLEEKRRALGAPDTAPPRFPKVRGPHATPAGDTREEAEAEPHETPKGKRHQKRTEPAVDAKEEAEDAGYARVPAGEYEAVLVRVHQVEQWGRWRWICWWSVISPGPANGIELPQYLPRPKDDRASPRRGWAVTAAYTVATGRRPPRNLARLDPSKYLGGAVFVVRVGDVERDQFGAIVPPAARYSRVKNIIRRSTGTEGGGPS